MIRVLLAEDQAMVRGALAALLSREQDIEVVAEVAGGDEVVQAALASQPDVALLDIEMPGGDGLAAAQASRKALPSCRSVILTTFGRSGYLRRAMESGAVGFLLKDAPAENMLVLMVACILRGFIEEGTTTTPFDMVVRNGMSRYQLCIEAMRRATRLRKLTPPLIAECDDLLARHTDYVLAHLEDMPEVRDWPWVE